MDMEIKVKGRNSEFFGTICKKTIKIYAHPSTKNLEKMKSPLDALNLKKEANK